MILALDLGTKMGWACAHNGKIQSGSCDFSPKSKQGTGMRYLKFQHWLDQAHTLGTTEGVYYEQVMRHVGMEAAHVYGGLHGILTAWCERNSIPYCGVPVGTWKKAFVGAGNADKEDVMAECRRRGHNPATNDEADAIGILRYVLAENGWEVE